jgi:hypothetical protein
MQPPAVPVPQEAHRGKQRRVDSNGDEQMGEINVIFGGSMSIASKTQGKKIQHEIHLAQRIESGRMMKWFDVSISFGPEDHTNTELCKRTCLSWSRYQSGSIRWPRH